MSSWYSRNKEKAAATSKAWREANKEYDKERKRLWYEEVGRVRDLEKLYGLTFEDYMKIRVAQNFKCAICETHESESDLCVDHNHTTKQVRGLLCYDCNRNFIGKEESPRKFMRAGEYLRHFWQEGTRKKLA